MTTFKPASVDRWTIITKKREGLCCKKMTQDGRHCSIKRWFKKLGWKNSTSCRFMAKIGSPRAWLSATDFHLFGPNSCCMHLEQTANLTDFQPLPFFCFCRFDQDFVADRCEKVCLRMTNYHPPNSFKISGNICQRRTSIQEYLNPFSWEIWPTTLSFSSSSQTVIALQGKFVFLSLIYCSWSLSHFGGKKVLLESLTSSTFVYVRHNLGIKV